MTALLFGVLLVSPVTPLETGFPLRLAAGLWSVRGRFQGRDGYFVLATERLSSAASAGFIEGRSGEKSTGDAAMELGSTHFESIPEGPMDRVGIAGAVGVDFFAGKRVTFDLDRRTVSIAQGPGKAPKGATEIPAHRGLDGTLSIDLTFGGKSQRFIVASGTYRSGLFSAATAAIKFSHAYNYNVFNASLGKFQVASVCVGQAPKPLPGPWLLFETLPEATIEEYASDPAGFLTPEDFGAGRVTLDFAREAVVLEEGSKEAALSRFLARLTDLPVDVVGDKIRIGTLAGSIPVGLKIFDGAELLSWGGIESKDLLRAVRGNKEADRDLAAKIAATAKQPRVIRLLRGEKIIELSFDADGLEK